MISHDLILYNIHLCHMISHDLTPHTTLYITWPHSPHYTVHHMTSLPPASTLVWSTRGFQWMPRTLLRVCGGRHRTTSRTATTISRFSSSVTSTAQGRKSKTSSCLMWVTMETTNQNSEFVGIYAVSFLRFVSECSLVWGQARRIFNLQMLCTLTSFQTSGRMRQLPSSLPLLFPSLFFSFALVSLFFFFHPLSHLL